ncbi:accessory gene regulator B family protein [Lachnospiraceae bacterium 54-53]
MVTSRLSTVLCNWLNKANPRSEDENIVIQYGFELVLDNVIKLFFIGSAGLLLGKGWETIVILLSFCVLRLQAGGVHAKSNVGCGLGMILVWSLSLIGSMFIKINAPISVMLYVIYTIITACLAPRSKNLDYFTDSSKKKKKLMSIIIMTILMSAAFFCVDLRELIIFPVTLEVLTLLPRNNTNVKGD